MQDQQRVEPAGQGRCGYRVVLQRSGGESWGAGSVVETGQVTRMAALRLSVTLLGAVALTAVDDIDE